MTKEDIWKLFELTGNISYYIKYKEMINEGSKNGNNKGKWNYN